MRSRLSSGLFVSSVLVACCGLWACEPPTVATNAGGYGSNVQQAGNSAASTAGAGGSAWTAAGVGGGTTGNQAGAGRGAAGSGAAGSTGIAGNTGIAGTSGIAGSSGSAGSSGFAGSSGASGTGTAGTGGAGGGGGTGGTTQSSLTSLTFDVLTHAQGGNYQPNNIGAIWVETGAGKFVKTLEVWAFIRIFSLTKYAAETGSNNVDAVTGATLTQHKAHHVTWNMKDATGAAAPDGDYKIIVEVTDKDATGQFTAATFTKGSALTTVSLPDTQYFTAMKITAQ